jgi:hypothetical protein
MARDWGGEAKTSRARLTRHSQLKKYPNLWRFEKNAWEANIIDMFAWSPALCQYLEMNKEWYDEELMGLKTAGEANRRQGCVKQPF